MALYEALYGHHFKSPLTWHEAGEKKVLECDLQKKTQLIEDTTKAIKVIKHRIATTQSRQKSYVDVRRRPLEFVVGDFVFIKVALMKEIMRFRNKGKLSPRYVGPFKIVNRIGQVVYELILLAEMSGICNVFHMSTLNKYIADPEHFTVP